MGHSPLPCMCPQTDTMGGRTRSHSARKEGLLTLALLADLYVANIGADKHTVLLVLRILIMVVAQGPIQPQSEPVPFPAAKDRACEIFQTRQAG